MSEPVRYLTDDRDAKDRQELVIQLGGNGDWYVATVPEGTGTMGRGVRICTSGGAQRAAPGLGIAIADAYRALQTASVDIHAIWTAPAGVGDSDGSWMCNECEVTFTKDVLPELVSFKGSQWIAAMHGMGKQVPASRLCAACVDVLQPRGFHREAQQVEVVVPANSVLRFNRGGWPFQIQESVRVNVAYVGSADDFLDRELKKRNLEQHPTRNDSRRVRVLDDGKEVCVVDLNTLNVVGLIHGPRACHDAIKSNLDTFHRNTEELSVEISEDRTLVTVTRVTADGTTYYRAFLPDGEDYEHFTVSHDLEHWKHMPQGKLDIEVRPLLFDTIREIRGRTT